MAISLEELRGILCKTAGAVPPQDTMGGQAMAAAAKMATPPGAGPLPAPISPPEQQAGPDASQMAALEEKQRKEVAGKDKEISDLRLQLSEMKLQTQQLKMQADIQNKQQQMLDKVHAEQKELDKRQTEFAAEEVRHKAQLQKDTAEQEVLRARQEAKSLADIAKRDAQSLSDIAKRDADSVKATANENAKAYIKMVEDVRRTADAYMANKQQAMDRQSEEAKKNNPYMSVALQSQIKGALAAANNVGKLRDRLAKDNAKWSTLSKSAAPYTMPQTAQSASPQQQPAQPTAPQPATPQTQPTPPTAPQTQPTQAQPATFTRGNWRADAHRASQQDVINRAQGERGVNAFMAAQGSDLYTRRKVIAQLKGRLQWLNSAKGQGTASDKEAAAIMAALERQQKSFNRDLADIQARVKDGTATDEEKDSLARFRDGQFLRYSTGWEALVPGTEGETEYDRIERAIANNMSLAEYENRDRTGWWGMTKGFILSPFDTLGDATQQWRHASALARNRGVERGFFDSGMEGDAAMKESFRRAAAERGLSTGWGSDLGTTALAGGLAAADLLFLKGVGGGVLRAAQGIGRLGAPVRKLAPNFAKKRIAKYEANKAAKVPWKDATLGQKAYRVFDGASTLQGVYDLGALVSVGANAAFGTPYYRDTYSRFVPGISAPASATAPTLMRNGNALQEGKTYTLGGGYLPWNSNQIQYAPSMQKSSSFSKRAADDDSVRAGQYSFADKDNQAFNVAHLGDFARQIDPYRNGIPYWIKELNPFIQAATGVSLVPSYKMPINAGEVANPMDIADVAHMAMDPSWTAAFMPSSLRDHVSPKHAQIYNTWRARQTHYEPPRYNPSFATSVFY